MNIDDDLTGGRLRVLRQHGENRVGVANPGDAPGADAPVGYEPLADRNEVLDILVQRVAGRSR